MKSPDVGTAIAIPLQYGGFALGVICSRQPRGDIVVMRAFGPRAVSISGLAPLDSLRPSNAVFVGQTGTGGLAEGFWKIVGKLDSFDRDIWNVRRFRRFEGLGRGFVVTYSANNPNKVESEQHVDPAELVGLPDDVLIGWYNFAANVDDALRERERADPDVWGDPPR